MKSIILTLLILCPLALFGQAPFYSFTHSSQPYQNLPTSAISLHNWDDRTSAIGKPINFPFYFYGRKVDSVYIEPFFGNLIFSSFHMMNFEIVGSAYTELGSKNNNESSIRIQYVGTSPNRILKIEWFNVMSGSWLNSSIYRQIWIYEQSSKIEFRFGEAINPGSGASIVIDGFLSNERFMLEGDPLNPTLSTSVWYGFLDDYPPKNKVYTFTRNDMGHISISSPKSMASAYPNTNIDVEWASKGVSNVKIELIVPGMYYPIDSNIMAASGYYNWKVPNALMNYTYLKISSQDNPRVFDFKPIRINTGNDPFLKLSVWPVYYSEVDVSWYGDNISDVKIELSTDSGKTWQFISTEPIMSISFKFPAPGVNSRKCFIRASNASDTTYYIISRMFAILPKDEPSLTITYPEKGTVVRIGETLVMGVSTNMVDSFKVELSVDEGQNWTTLSEKAMTWPPFQFTVPNLRSSTCRMRITDVTDPSVSFTMEENFSIEWPVSIQPEIGSNAGNQLYQNFPNPFQTETTIKYYLYKPQEIRLAIFDMNGKLVFNYEAKNKEGEHEISFSAPEPGVYFYKLITPEGVKTKKLLKL